MQRPYISTDKSAYQNHLSYGNSQNESFQKRASNNLDIMSTPAPASMPPNKKARPQLRVVTDEASLSAIAQAKQRVSFTQPASFVYVTQWPAPAYRSDLPVLGTVEESASIEQTEDVSLHRPGTELSSQAHSESRFDGRKRRLPEKLKSLLPPAFRLKRHGGIQVVLPDPDNHTRDVSPQIPVRSLSTASFMISRHISPTSSFPVSAGSCYTACLMSLDTNEGQVKIYQDGGEDVSYFSDPSPLSSTDSTSTAWSTPSSTIFSDEPSLDAHNVEHSKQPRKAFDLDDGQRRMFSMPDMRYLSGIN